MLSEILTIQSRTFGREKLGSPIKPPQGALLSRYGTERCGKGSDYLRR